MLLSAIFLIIFYIQLKKTSSLNRRFLAISAFIVYVIITYFDLIFIENVNNISFHYSDPTYYYLSTLNIPFRNIFLIENASNAFYFIINWIYNHVYDNTTIISSLIKLNNVLIILCSYLLLSKKINKISYLDFILLFNPYLLITIIRNTRDAYIILFVSIILIGLDIINNNRISKLWVMIAVVLLFITRPILLFPLALILIIKNKLKFKRYITYSFIIIAIAILFIYRNYILFLVGSQILSSLSYIGEDVTTLLPLLEGKISVSILIFLFKRMFIGFISFIFTPHPINYFLKWTSEMNSIGTYNIYTGFDNFLILIGSIYSYIFILPLTIVYFHKYRKQNKYLFIFILWYIIIYVIAYIGITDIRNRHLAFFFIIFALAESEISPRIPFKYIISVILIFCGISVLSY